MSLWKIGAVDESCPKKREVSSTTNISRTLSKPTLKSLRCSIMHILHVLVAKSAANI